VLTPIADKVLVGVCQLFQYYIFSVNSFFGMETNSGEVHSARLQAALIKTYQDVIQHQVEKGEEEVTVGCIEEATLCPNVKLDETGIQGGFHERIIGVESVVFLASQLQSLKPYLEASFPLSEDALTGFYSSFVDLMTDLRQPVYLCAVSRVIDTGSVLSLMSRVSWDQREVVTQHSAYVEQLLALLKEFSCCLDAVGSQVPLSPQVLAALWLAAVTLANRTFLEGFSSAKKCTQEGRALMQLDYRQFVMKCEVVSGLKPLPGQELVTTYIKAYYLPETELEDWVSQHQEYSPHQLRALVTSVAYSNNKTKQKLNNLINDLSERIRR